MRGFRRLTALAITFTFMLIVLGAVVRSTGSGLACPDWPRCYGLWLLTPGAFDGLGTVDYTYGQVMLEWTHRLIAGIIVGPMVLWLVIWSFRLGRESGNIRSLMITALILVMIQAGLGGVTVLKGNVPWSVAVHLSVALTFMATLIFVYMSSDRHSGLSQSSDLTGAGARSLAGFALLTALLTIASGAFTAKSGASLACSSWPLCEGWQMSDMSDWLTRIHMGHRMVALLCFLFISLLYGVGIRFRDQAPRFHRDARAALLLVATEVTLGAIVVFAEVPLWGAVIHQAFGALVFSALAVTFLRPYAKPRERFGFG